MFLPSSTPTLGSSPKSCNCLKTPHTAYNSEAHITDNMHVTYAQIVMIIYLNGFLKNR